MYCTKEKYSSKFDFHTNKGLILSLFFLAILLPITIVGQKNFEAGYIVLNNQDTLYGFIKDRKPHPFGGLYKKIKFKGKSRKSKFGPREILAYKKGGSIFESLWVGDSGKLFDQSLMATQDAGEAAFFKVAARGFLSYYHREFEDADSGYIDYIAYFKKEDNSKMVRVNQGLFGVRRKALIQFFNDCPPLAEKIRNKEIKDAFEIARFYNEWKKKVKSQQL